MGQIYRVECPELLSSEMLRTKMDMQTSIWAFTMLETCGPNESTRACLSLRLGVGDMAAQLEHYIPILSGPCQRQWNVMLVRLCNVAVGVILIISLSN